MNWGWICPSVSETSEPHPGTRDCKDNAAEHFDSFTLFFWPIIFLLIKLFEVPFTSLFTDKKS
jgi:hypothetical protein